MRQSVHVCTQNCHLNKKNLGSRLRFACWLAQGHIGWRCLTGKCQMAHFVFFYLPGIKVSIRNKTNVTHAPFLPLIFWFSVSVTQKENKDESVLHFYANCHLAFFYQKRNRTFAVQKMWLSKIKSWDIFQQSERLMSAMLIFIFSICLSSYYVRKFK